MIYTFYSFKGGVGRSMALANVAELLYKRGADVLIIDFDLEAPGLERYFNDPPAVFEPNDIQEKRGVIDLLLSYKEMRSLPPSKILSTDKTLAPRDKEIFPFPVEPLSNFIVPIYKKSPEKGSLSIIPAGAREKENNAKYAKNVLSFGWDDFFKNCDGEQFFEWFRREAKNNADYVLIDSRTGFTEMSGVCTYHLADTVVIFVSPNQQSIGGTLMMAKSLSNPKLIQDARKGRALSLVFVPSRVEMTEVKLNNFANRFDKTFGRRITIPLLSGSAFDELKIPYSPYYAFEEKVAIREDNPASRELAEAFTNLTDVIQPDFLANDFFRQALVFNKDGIEDKAIEFTKNAIEIWEKLSETNLRLFGLKLAKAKEFLSILFEESNEKASLTEAVDAIEIYLNLYNANPIKFRGEVVSHLAELAYRLRDTKWNEEKKAEESLLTVIRIVRRWIQSESASTQEKIINSEVKKLKSDLAMWLHDLSNWLIEEERFTEAIKVLEEVVILYKELKDINQKDFKVELADALLTLSECQLEINEINCAQINAVEATEIYKSLYQYSRNKYESETAKSYNALLDILSRNEINRENGSLALVLKAEHFFRKLSKTDPKRYKPDLAKTITMFTGTLFKDGKVKKAIEKLEEAIEIFREIKSTHLAQYEPDLASSLKDLSNFLSKKDAQAARKAAEEALEIYKKLAKQSPVRFYDDLKETEKVINELPSIKP